jgi:hypothetical protein
MEFERAIYRVYERCLDGLHDTGDAEQPMQVNTKSCRMFEVYKYTYTYSYSFIILLFIIL